MLRTVTLRKWDVCPGDIRREIEYQLDDNMTIPDFLNFIARNFLVSFLHYRWTISSGPPFRTIGYIAHDNPEEKRDLKSPKDVCEFLTYQLHNSKLIWCCVPPEATLKDLNITDVLCETD